MTNTHWSDEEMLHRLYGLEPGDRHLEVCEDCRLRWRELTERRRQFLMSADVPAGVLAAQRQAIYERIEGSATFRSAPVVAALAVILLALLLSLPSPNRQATIASGDAQFYADIYKVIGDEEPRAAQPIHALFKE